MPNSLCGPVFEGLPARPEEIKKNVLWYAEEMFRIFYLMVENIMTVKEEEEKA